jgi:hypothetical protein
MRLVGAEFLKLRRRTGLMLAALALPVVPAVIFLMVTGGGDSESGGLRTFADSVAAVASLSLVAGVLVGATLGTADLSSGVFRDLVVTGRSRLQLFAARVPAGLGVLLAVAGTGFAIAALSAIVSAGSVPSSFKGLGTVAPSVQVLVESAGWVALVTLVCFTVSFGIASRVGSRGSSIAMLLGYWLVLTPLVDNLESLHWLRPALVVAALGEVMPAGLHPGDTSDMTLTAAVAALVGWSVVPVVAGAWRTCTRDA